MLISSNIFVRKSFNWRAT